jgi:hypothetical protein
MRQRTIIALTAVLCTHALAQPPGQPPLLDYRPALRDYVPYREAEPKDWRAANDTVGRLGGHMGHALRPGDAPRPSRDDASGRPAAGTRAGERP